MKIGVLMRKDHRRVLVNALMLVVCLSACKQENSAKLANGDAKLRGDAPISVLADGAAGSYEVDFGQVAVGQRLDATVELLNDGSAPLTIVMVDAPSAPEFSVVLPPPVTVQAGAQVTVPVSFKPFVAGPTTAVAGIQTDSTTTPLVSLQLVGVGVDVKLSVAPKTVDFGNVVVHSQKALRVTLTNKSTLDLSMTAGTIE